MLVPSRGHLLDQPVINDHPRFANRLKAGLVVADFEDHKVVVVVKGRCAETAFPVHVSAPNLPRSTRDEIMNALLRLGALVDVIVAREGYAHAVTGKQRLETRSQTG